MEENKTMIAEIDENNVDVEMAETEGNSTFLEKFVIGTIITLAGTGVVCLGRLAVKGFKKIGEKRRTKKEAIYEAECIDSDEQVDSEEESD